MVLNDACCAAATTTTTTTALSQQLLYYAEASNSQSNSKTSKQAFLQTTFVFFFFWILSLKVQGKAYNTSERRELQSRTHVRLLSLSRLCVCVCVCLSLSLSLSLSREDGDGWVHRELANESSLGGTLVGVVINRDCNASEQARDSQRASELPAQGKRSSVDGEKWWWYYNCALICWGGQSVCTYNRQISGVFFFIF
jgi:hypothetical protein